MKPIYKPLFFILISIATTACLKEDQLKKTFTRYAPKGLNDGHIIASPEDVNINPDELEKVYRGVHEDDELWQIRSLLVFRNGNLVAESYMKDDSDITKPGAIWSCTKQILGVLTGMALEEDIIENINDPIAMYIPDLTNKYPDKADISIVSLLTMQSGIGYINEGIEGQTDDLLRELPDRIMDFVLARPIIEPQGEVFHYNDGDPHIIAGLLQEALNKPMDEWADEVLFSKLGINNLEWRRYKDGTTQGGYGILTTPRDLAKITLCVADGGKWRGEQLVSEDWISTMTSVIIDTLDFEYDFGYYWWIDSVRNIHFMWGHGGQFAFVCPDKNVVIVMTSEPNTQSDHEISADHRHWRL